MLFSTFFLFQKPLKAAAANLAMTKENHEGWESVHLDPNEGGVMGYKNSLEDFTLAHMSSVNISYGESMPPYYDHVKREYQVHVDSDDITLSASKQYPSDFQRMGKTIELQSFYTQKARIKDAKILKYREQIEIPTKFNFKDQELCGQAPFSLLTAIYESLGPIAPIHRNPRCV